MNDKEIYKIVLTGGPCAGKTTALTKLEEMLTDAGFHVLIVSESATELIKGGARPFGNGKIDMTDFQTLMVDYQLQKERIYLDACRLIPNNKIVIIYDRGVVDNKAYINQEKYTKIIADMNLSEIELMDAYNLVLHLTTAALGATEFYTLANNQARTETVEEAIALDRKTLEAWVGHPNLKIIDNDCDFEGKMEKVIDEVSKLIGLNKNILHQRKFLVDVDSIDLSVFNEDNSTRIDIIQSYLESDSKYEKRLRKRCIHGISTYYLTTIKKLENGKEIVTEKKISEKEYLYLLSEYNIKGTIEKVRYAFLYEREYYTLDIFNKGLAILETNSEEELTLPNNMKIIKEVTGNPEYNNSSLAMKALSLEK